jgi:PleD family two-component response regulator
VYNERVKERSEERTAEQSPSLIPRKINKNEENDKPQVLLKILIVEDSLSILKVVCHMLRQKGHTVQSALNGSLGLDMMTQGYHGIAFDVVLMDLQMPVMDGIEATRRYIYIHTYVYMYIYINTYRERDTYLYIYVYR